MNEIKRSWFPNKNQDTAALKRTACYVEAQKGVYCSVRLCQGGPRTGVALNVDVANAVFWSPQGLIQACCAMYGREKNNNLNLNKYLEELLPVKKRGPDNKHIKDRAGNIEYEPSAAWKDLRKLAGVMVEVNHQLRDKAMKCTIAQFEFYKFAPGPADSIEYQRETAGNYGEGGATAAKVFFDYTDKDTGVTRNISVAQYWKEKYKIDLSKDPWPLMRARKGGFVPMQFCKIIANQRYKFKLDPDQTSDMIKFAVTKPEQRLQSINRGIGMLKWATDPILNHIGIKIEQKCTKTNAVILQPPAIQFGLGGREELKKPGTSGSWRMTNTRLFKPCRPLNTWVLMVLDECITRQEWGIHYECMKTEARNLGMEIRKDPQPLVGPAANLERLIDDYMGRFTGKDFETQLQNFPQLFFIVVRDKNSHAYERIKSILDTKYAVHSQVVQSLQLKSKNGRNAQYASNVLLKINAKLGGTTSRACRLNKSTIGGSGRARAHTQPDYLKSITTDKTSTKQKLVMAIGADVSHPGSLSDAPSFAAVTMSMDADLIRYTATCETNYLDKAKSGKDQKQGTEIIQQATFDKMTGMIDQWLRTVGSTPQAVAAANLHLCNAPAHIFYMRDGVSEGQYQYVLKQEVKHLRETLVKRCKGFANSKITVIVASKRHHLRMLPSKGDTCIDNNGNPMPGTLVERDITHPFENDFYLVSHRAIQGTARPIHYAVLMDEGKFRPDELIDWIYASCYQFVRSTTPVSIHPAIYYAHLASKRGTAHENINFKAHGPRHGGEGHQQAIMNKSRQASAVEGNKALVKAGKEPEFDEESKGKPLPEVQKLRGLGMYWRNEKVTPKERMPHLLPMYRSFAYGMWFI